MHEYCKILINLLRSLYSQGLNESRAASAAENNAHIPTESTAQIHLNSPAFLGKSQVTIHEYCKIIIYLLRSLYSQGLNESRAASAAENNAHIPTESTAQIHLNSPAFFNKVAGKYTRFFSNSYIFSQVLAQSNRCLSIPST